jgi:hypothetical protein
MTAKYRNKGLFHEHLNEIEERCKKGNLSLAEIFAIFGAEGHYVLIAFLILPFLQPIPLFGLSAPFGLMIGIVGILAYLGLPPWLPRCWARRELSATTVMKIVSGWLRISQKVSVLLHSRWKYLLSGPFKLVNLILLIGNAILLALPLPFPFSNALPAWMILFQALAHLEKDGVFIMISYAQTCLCVVYFGLIGLGVGTGLQLLAAG